TIASCLVMFVALPFGEAATTRPQPAPHGQQAGSVQAQPGNSDGTNKPVVDATQSQASPDGQDSAPPQSVDPSKNSGVSQGAPEQPQNSNPVGTAAAPYEKTTGNAASRPAGAVIAPAKQRRTRSILIRVGILLGAAVAIGTVVGLSSASPSRPR
ncbi:MAG: hypothetical protein ABI076_07560, partial [Acidobacteriaceae bacterium]